eukprot:752190-Hanusia_phi.AAC.3
MPESPCSPDEQFETELSDETKRSLLNEELRSMQLDCEQKKKQASAHSALGHSQRRRYSDGEKQCTCRERKSCDIMFIRLARAEQGAREEAANGQLGGDFVCDFYSVAYL